MMRYPTANDWMTRLPSTMTPRPTSAVAPSTKGARTSHAEERPARKVPAPQKGHGRRPESNATRPAVVDELEPRAGQLMRGIDASFIASETPQQPAHTIKWLEIDVSGAGYSRRAFLQAASEYLQRFPALRLRVEHTKGRPYWLDGPIDLNAHIRFSRLPSDDRALLDRLIGEIASGPLDLSRPLWQLDVLEVGPSKLVVVAKVHHALADGGAVSNLLKALGSVSRGPASNVSSELAQPVPNASARWWGRFTRRVRNLFAFPGIVLDSVVGAARAASARRAQPGQVPRAFERPRTHFNGPIGPERGYASASISMDQVHHARRELSRALGTKVSVNDFFLALCAGAMRRYMEQRGDDVSLPLVASMPISAAEGAEYLAGNRVSNSMVSLPIQEREVLSRVRAAQLNANGSIAVAKSRGLGGLTRWTELVPRPLLHWFWKTKARTLSSPPINLVVSNVRGPDKPIEIEGGKVLDLYSSGPVLEGVGLNITVWSYADKLNFSIMTSRDNVHEPEKVAAAIEEAAWELFATAGKAGRVTPGS